MRFSLATKLLASVVSIVFVSIATLNIASVFILERDRLDFTFQAQATEGALYGREFVSLAYGAAGTLRLALAEFSPQRGWNPATASAISLLRANQSQLRTISIVRLKDSPDAGAFEILGTEGESVEWDLPGELKSAVSAEARKTGFALFNATAKGGLPALGIVFADASAVRADGGLPAALGIVSLDGWGREFGTSGEVVIANSGGWVLFSLDPAAIFSRANLAEDPLFTEANGAGANVGAREYRAEGRRFLGSFYKPGLGIVVTTRLDWRKAMAATYSLTEKFILIGLMGIGLAVLFAVFFARTISGPVLRLYEATRRVASGDFNLVLPRSSSDEIGALTGSFEAMSRKIVELIEERMKQVQLENELAITSTLQKNLFPPTSMALGPVRIESYYKAAAQCGGDWWGYFTSGGRLCVMIADATGHGLPSALITAAARSCFSVLYKLAQEDPEFSYSPSAMLEYANRVINEAAHGNIMMTFFVATLDLENGEMVYSSAGHNPPWLFQKQGDSYKLKSLVARGQRLGEALDHRDFEEIRVPINAGDILFAYTDGLLEGKNPAGDQYGKKRARRLLEESLPQGPRAVVERLISDFMEHNGDKALDDDVTLSVVEIVSTGRPVPDVPMSRIVSDAGEDSTQVHGMAVATGTALEGGAGA